MTRSAHRRTPPPLPAAGTTFFDTQTGFAVPRWCPPLLGLEPHCPPARYLGEWVGDGTWSRTDARRVAAMRAAGNARRVYRLV